MAKQFARISSNLLGFARISTYFLQTFRAVHQVSEYVPPFSHPSQRRIHRPFAYFSRFGFNINKFYFIVPPLLEEKKKIKKNIEAQPTVCLRCAHFIFGWVEEKNHNVVQINSWLFLHGMCLYAFLALLAICWASIDCEFHKCHPDIHLSISIHLTRLQLQCEKFQWDIILIDAPGSST